MKYLPERGYRRVLVLAAYILLGAGAVYVTLRYLLRPFLPFFAAWGIAMMLRPAVRRIAARTKLPEKAVSVAAVTLVFVLIFGILAVLCERMIAEMRGLSEDLVADAADAVGELFDSLQELIEKLPFLERIENPEAAEQVRHSLLTMIETAVGGLSARVPEILMETVASLPRVLLFTVAMIAATYYMGGDISRINGFIARQLPADRRRHLFEAKAKLASAGIRYVKAYLMILFITFWQLLIGFLCLKIPYALTLAAVIALIDILPVLGVGTVLLPWALLLFLRGDYYTGVGLLIMFVVITVVRQVAEPKIVGKSIGLPPLATLIAMYAGYLFMGVGGLFFFPLGVILLKNLNDIGVLKLWKD